MSSDETLQDVAPQVDKPTEGDTQMASATVEPTPAVSRKRPRIDLSSDTREKKRGKTMFGLLVGTLNKAKNEDRERNATEAAKKRQEIDQRLQDKLKKETDSVRRAEEAKKEKQVSNRKEEELQLKDSVYKLRRTRLPLLANFLLTSDMIPTDEDVAETPSANPLAPIARSHPPPLYYLPAILTPAQEAFMSRRKTEVQEAVEKEWQGFREERTNGIEEINQLRQRVAEEESRRKVESKEDEGDQENRPIPTAPREAVRSTDEKPDAKQEQGITTTTTTEDAQMEVDESVNSTAKEDNKPDVAMTVPTTGGADGEEDPKEEQQTPMQADEDDAVEY